MPECITPSLQILNNAGNSVKLNPRTVTSQALTPPLGQVFGPFTLTLNTNSWNSTTKQATLTLTDITNTDIPIVCLSYKSGLGYDLQKQRTAFNLLDPIIGVESLNGQIRFTCTTSVPTVALQVEVSWTR